MWRQLLAKNVPCGEKMTNMMYAHSSNILAPTKRPASWTGAVSILFTYIPISPPNHPPIPSEWQGGSGPGFSLQSIFQFTNLLFSLLAQHPFTLHHLHHLHHLYHHCHRHHLYHHDLHNFLNHQKSSPSGFNHHLQNEYSRSPTIQVNLHLSIYHWWTGQGPICIMYDVHINT